jgi:hypothetical protein
LGIIRRSGAFLTDKMSWQSDPFGSSVPTNRTRIR